MKVGSLVKLKRKKIVAEPGPGEIFPKPNVIYTVRAIFDHPLWPSLVLEEIINPIDPTDGVEYSWWGRCFNEVLPPKQQEIEELLEQPELV